MGASLAAEVLWDKNFHDDALRLAKRWREHVASYRSEEMSVPSPNHRLGRVREAASSAP